jgi:electron transfer flavoprotein beta subunit
MEIIVCVKQVPDARDVKIDPETNTLKREGAPSMVNPYDMYAVEAALRLRDEHGGRAVALSMGPPQAEEALRKVVEYGVDQAVLLSDRVFAGADTWATSYTLAQGVRRIGDFDLIVCGKQAADGDTAQVGPELAEWLDIPFVSFVRRLVSLDAERRVLTVQRMMDDGYDVVEVELPALITVVKEIGDLRVPSLKGKMKAKKLDIPVYNFQDIGADPEKVGLAGSPTQVAKIFAPQPRGEKTVIEGDPDEAAARLLDHLRADKVI